MPRPMPYVAAVATTVATVATLVSVLLLGASPPAGALAPGTSGIGDPYFPFDGNGGIDVTRYRVHDTYRFDDRRLSGRTTLTVRATQDLTRFDLDFLLPVSGVTVDGTRATYARPNRHELRIRPRRPIADGERFVVTVRYAGHPGRTSWQGESNWLADRHEVVAMNEPHMAAWWFPANDHPRDKARMDISITVPRDRQVVANGIRVARRVHGRVATTRWRAAEPMAPYLAFFAAGRYAVDKGRHDGLPWYVAVSKQLPTRARQASMRLMRRTPAVVAWLESQLGDYPFSTTGGLTTGLDPGFALENQTRPTYPAVGGGATWLVVHELAHQWFGDSVSVDRWRDIWLNEGPATFLELRYRETHGGSSAEQWLRRTYDSRGAGGSFWDLRIARPGRDHIFADAVYQRGAMALQALRNRVGDDDFWTILRTWLADRQGGNGSTEQFQDLAESVSGLDLDGFFTAWLFTGEKPADTVDNGLG